ncbi:hypothetical protein A0H81_13949 [Grifola frondosa]|uniref:Dynactin subunit 2 n=1 Tax=Grifola frondosa TaxID=5627 RepID=A0A1C7LMU3_GRIFR|nr:hypothetical protein A0H81_13949 [Grifola frondosa]
MSDTAPDVYETEDVFPSAQDNKGDSSEDESNAPTRSHPRGKSGEASGKEELDASSLMGAEEASKKFRKAERKHRRPRIQYTYPSSPTSSRPASPTTPAPSLPLSQRLRVLQAELAALETELADPSNPLLKEENEVEPGELIRGMVDVKRRLNKISKVKEGRGKLVSVVLGEDDRHAEEKDEAKEKSDNMKSTDASPESETKPKTPDVRDIVEIDHRVGELEKLIGSSTTALDELSPLPPPILPMLTRLNAQMTLLTQPRHIDSVSRRLKLLGSDLERVSNANAQQHGTQRRQPHHPTGPATSHPASPAVPSPPTPVTALDHLTPVLTRLAPLLPHIPTF